MKRKDYPILIQSNKNAILKPQKFEVLNQYLGSVLKADQYAGERKSLQVGSGK